LLERDHHPEQAFLLPISPGTRFHRQHPGDGLHLDCRLSCNPHALAGTG